MEEKRANPFRTTGHHANSFLGFLITSPAVGGKNNFAY
jgi:hypothetical protein